MSASVMKTCNGLREVHLMELEALEEHPQQLARTRAMEMPILSMDVLMRLDLGKLESTVSIISLYASPLLAVHLELMNHVRKAHSASGI